MDIKDMLQTFDQCVHIMSDMAASVTQQKSVEADSDYDHYDDDDDDEDDYYNENDYYAQGENEPMDLIEEQRDDPEFFDFNLMSVEDVEQLLNKNVEALCQAINVRPSLAKVLLHTQNWEDTGIIQKYKLNPAKLLEEARITPTKKHQQDVASHSSSSGAQSQVICPVCFMSVRGGESVKGLSCGHMFCRECWQMYFNVQINGGVSTCMECMGKDCDILVPEDFVLSVVKDSKLRDKYMNNTFSDYVNRHPELRFCPGPNCTVIVQASPPKAKRVHCKQCNTTFCFKCAMEYHAPTDCDTIKKWLTKCADDSETANYISANTKDCPKCHVCIEKNGGCNHMQCCKCKYDFCWMCLGDWKVHGSEYYECSRYKENPNVVNEGAQAQAREALKKYLFYFERYENHAKSLKLEESTLCKIKARIEEKVMNNSGTWIDWQYLLDAAALLRKCRYTLQYTYPYAYYLQTQPKKQLFEYQQAQLEAEVENLSWKVERAEITDRGDLENQMDVAEKRRLTLVRDFLSS